MERRIGQTFAMLCSHDGDPIFQELGEALYCWFTAEIRKIAQELKKHLANVKGMREISDREEVSLEYAARKAQMAADRELRELDDEENEDDDEETAAKKRRRKRNERQKNDVVLDEAYKVLMDLIRMKGDEEVPEVKGWWY